MKLLKYCCSNSLVKLMHSLSDSAADEHRLREAGFFSCSFLLRDPCCSKGVDLEELEAKDVQPLSSEIASAPNKRQGRSSGFSILGCGTPQKVASGLKPMEAFVFSTMCLKSA